MLKQIDGPTETDRVTYVAGDEVTEFAMVPLNLRQVHFSYSSFRVSIGSRSGQIRFIWGRHGKKCTGHRETSTFS
ncbi:hypothetical protein HZH66_004489 [Vespula vulgaris]|uniref:Uncharacterized protein n=1 Tax=Vespula vulgaris TaxID=7454 RepID=A0A834KF41_VESVU|nr:hypothetical protein HZH66_004489 [Vespula vulgaris]